MTNCQFCDESVALPYTCSLCKNKYCGTHRLAESHNCENIGVYQTSAYRQQKLEKNREIQIINSGSFQESSSPSFQTRFFGTQSMWSTGSKVQDALLGGFILAVSGFISSLRSEISLNLLVFLGFITVGSLGFLLVTWFRGKLAQTYGISTEFVLWPLGIAITLITSIFIFRFLLFGFFFNSGGGDAKSESRLGIYTILAFAGIWLAAILYLIFVSPVVSSAFVMGLIWGSQNFLWFAIILMIPWGMLDGTKIFYTERTNYWILLVFLIGLLIINYIVF